jgi:hypothetical protein
MQINTLVYSVEFYTVGCSLQESCLQFSSCHMFCLYFCTLSEGNRSRDSEWLRAGRRRVRVRVPVGSKNFLHVVQTDSGSHPIFCPVGGVGVRVPVGSRIFSSARRPYRFWGPPSLVSSGSGRSSGRGRVKNFLHFAQTGLGPTQPPAQ